jgi:uncharacterized protein (TIGR02265 family)
MESNATGRREHEKLGKQQKKPSRLPVFLLHFFPPKLAKEMSDGFREPDPLAPLEVEARVAALPPGATVKGMFLTNLVELCERRSGKRPGRDRYVAFFNYPLREMIELLPQAAELAYPGLPPREGMRRLGRAAYPTFSSSTVGRVLMSMAGSDPRAALHLAPKAYRLIGNSGEARVIDVNDSTCILELRDVWGWPDAYNVGVHEGAIDSFGVDGRVTVRSHSLADVDLKIEWWPRAE